ncbi:MAG TPA: nuclear transport factor 2 family protein [Steroidobacteraceae bacterium]|nr:nuclear transport factor 2 family protein [Steroidobacteraceae bacterium]
MKVEHQWLAALHRRDVTMLARILAREFIDSDFQGGVISRAQYLAYFSRPVARPAAAVRQQFDDTRVRLISGGNVAIVTGVVVTRTAAPGARAETKAVAARYSRFTDVFVWRDGRWQAVTGQETRFAPGDDH